MVGWTRFALRQRHHRERWWVLQDFDAAEAMLQALNLAGNVHFVDAVTGVFSSKSRPF